MFYRFPTPWVHAEDFEDAKRKAIDIIRNSVEYTCNWTDCRCTGIDHDFGCPEKSDEIPY